MEKDMSCVHEVIFNYLLEMHRKEPQFYFTPRIKNNKNRLDKGYWFIGDDTYLQVSFWKGGDDNEKLHNIGFVVKDDGSSYIELASRKSEEKIQFLKRIMDKVAGFKQVRKSNKWRKYYKNDDYLENLNNFVKEIKPIIDSMIKEFAPKGLSMLEAEPFEKHISRIITIQKKKQTKEY